MSNRRTLLMVLLPLFIFIFLVIFLWSGLHRDPHELPTPLLNKPVPQFKASSLKNPEVFLTNKDLLGHVTILNVFATWCVSCQTEHPTWMDAHRHLNGAQLIGLDYKDSRVEAQQWLAQYGDPYSKVIFDPKGTVGINLGVYGTPETFIIDAKGIIRDKYTGPISPMVWEDELLPKIRKLEQ